MGNLSEAEKKRIVEEEELRAQVRKRHETASPGLAAVLSAVCPGLGQVYNLQLKKGSAYFLLAFASIILLVLGIAGMIRATAASGDPGLLAEEESLIMTDDGVVLDAERFEGPMADVPRPGRNLAFLLIGLVGYGLSRHFSVSDALRTARRANSPPAGGG